jgi:aerobic-type carbon monoxide dehydrogenase small subunit (CoxS/CutS family)
VLVDGVAPSCKVGIADAVGKEIVTIEGLARHDGLHPVQRAFSR